MLQLSSLTLLRNHTLQLKVFADNYEHSYFVYLFQWKHNNLTTILRTLVGLYPLDILFKDGLNLKTIFDKELSYDDTVITNNK